MRLKYGVGEHTANSSQTFGTHPCMEDSWVTGAFSLLQPEGGGTGDEKTLG